MTKRKINVVETTCVPLWESSNRKGNFYNPRGLTHFIDRRRPYQGAKISHTHAPAIAWNTFPYYRWQRQFLFPWNSPMDVSPKEIHLQDISHTGYLPTEFSLPLWLEFSPPDFTPPFHKENPLPEFPRPLWLKNSPPESNINMAVIALLWVKQCQVR